VGGSMEILGQSVYGSAYFSSQGEFRVAFGGSIQIGPSGFGVSGSCNFVVSRFDSDGSGVRGDGNYVVNVSGLVQGSISLFGFTLASASIGFGLDGSTGRVYITPSITINFFFFSITISTSFTLFYVKLPRPVFLAGNVDDSSGVAFRGGMLYLNTGSRAHMRNESEGETNEGYVITRISDDDEQGGEILRIRAFGRSQTFYGVTGIVADMGSGSDYLEIDSGVRAPVTMYGGDGYDYFIQNGLGTTRFESNLGAATVQIGNYVSNPVTIVGSGDRQEVTVNSTGSIWADLQGGDDEMHIGGGNHAAVTVYAGSGDDTVTYDGSGPFLIFPGTGNNTVQGGSGSNTFRYENDFGFDSISTLGGTSDLDFSRVTAPLEVQLSTASSTVSARRPDIRTLGNAIINSQPVVLLPYKFTEVTVLMPGHGFVVGDSVAISAPKTPDYNGEFLVTAVTTDTFQIAAKSILQAGEEAALSFQQNEATDIYPVQVYHDGADTAYLSGDLPAIEDGSEIWLSSKNPGYDGQFIVRRISSVWYSLTKPWNSVRSVVQASFAANTLQLGSGDDTITVVGNRATLNLFDFGGADSLIVSGFLSSFARVTTSSLNTANLAISYTNMETLQLQDSSAHLTVTGSNSSSVVELEDMSLQIIAETLVLPVNLTARSLEIAVRDTLTLAHQIDVLDLDVRVFGDEAGIALLQPLTVSHTAQFAAPDGTLELPAGVSVTAETLAIRTRQLQTANNQLNLSVDTLTIVTAVGHTTALKISNDRNLQITRRMDAGHIVTLDAGISAVFQNISWVATVSDDWADQVFDGALNPFAAISSGLIDITLPTAAQPNGYGLTIDGQLRSTTGSLTFTVDELDFLGGPASVQAPGELTIRSASNPWHY
ncbi:MAG TPA: hypothetical protein DIT89_07140, partial [Planctomycetaceae bacterium]|nr:hypothetical protein [Planctomycetaceae bacterium]